MFKIHINYDLKKKKKKKKNAKKKTQKKNNRLFPEFVLKKKT